MSYHDPALAPYPSQKLHGIKHNIRLLRILPGQPGEPIHCNLNVGSLKDGLQYEALSYRWGPHAYVQPVYINNIDFMVGQNLFDALQNLRLADQERTLWIDAICIDQTNLQERNHQVQQMGEIYRRATRVLVWLGQSSESSRAAFSFLRYSYLRSPFNRKELMHDTRWKDLNALGQNPYWGRVWIVQEICLGSRVLVVCGNDEVPWGHITALRVARKSIWPRYLSEGEQAFMRSFVARIDHQRELTRKGADCRLWSLLESFKGSDCQEPHDKVYGFMGLCTDLGVEDGIEVNYAKPIRELYRDVIWFYYRVFRGGFAPPHAPQLMALSISLRNILPIQKLTEAPETLPQVTARRSTLPSQTHLTISASKIFRIHQWLSPENTGPDGKTLALVQFLDAKVPHSHLGPWRDWVDPALIDVSSLPSRCAIGVSHIQTPNLENEPSRIERPTAFAGVDLGFDEEGGTPETSVLGIAPPGAQIGDLVCAFVDSAVNLIVRLDDTQALSDEKWGNVISRGLFSAPQPYITIGRAAVDWSRSSLGQAYESRIGASKDTETARLLPDGNQTKNSSPWPMTFIMDISTLEYLVSRNPDQIPQRTGETLLNMFPLGALQSPAHVQPWERRLRNEDLDLIRKDPDLKRHALGPGYAGIINLGATGYLSCALQILYLLKGLRDSILRARYLPGGSELHAIQQIFQHLQESSLPVSPAELVKAFGWKDEELSEPKDVFDFFQILLQKLELQKHSRSVGAYVKHLFEGQHRMSKLIRKKDGQWYRYSLAEPFWHLQCSTKPNSSSLKSCLDDLGVMNDTYDLVLEHPPPVLTLYPWFFMYDLKKGTIDVNPCHFEFPSRLNLSDHFMVNSKESKNVEYQLHCVVVREEVQPTPRFLLYVRPRQENRWLLFFNDQVTWARENEVFETNFNVNQNPEQPGNRVLGLLIYVQVSKLNELLD